MGDVGEALRVRADGDTRWLAWADPDHESINAMYGGWTVGVALAGVTESAALRDVVRQPSALTVNFLGPVAPGSDIAVEVEHLRGTRSMDHWRVVLLDVASEEVVAAGMAVFTSRRPSDAHVQPVMPTVDEPDDLDTFHAPGTQGMRTVIRPARGEIGSSDSRTSGWVRESSGRPLDLVQLAYLADQYTPRSFFYGETPGPRPSATLTLSIYFHGTNEEIDAVGDDYILNEATGTRGEQSTSGQQARLWSRHGALLATSEQLAWFR